MLGAEQDITITDGIKNGSLSLDSKGNIVTLTAGNSNNVSIDTLDADKNIISTYSGAKTTLKAENGNNLLTIKERILIKKKTPHIEL